MISGSYIRADSGQGQADPDGIDDELLYITSYNIQTGTALVAAGTNGRGVFGTTAASHTTNTLVIADPDFPRSRIKEEINNTIRAMYPSLPVFNSYEFQKVAARYEYPIPANVEQ